MKLESFSPQRSLSMLANNALQRTGSARGPRLGAQVMVRQAASIAAWSAAQLGR
jgi:hypothetical protein